MTNIEHRCWLNGHIVPLSAARLPVWDQGLVHGAAVTEMLRTFGHRPFRVADHLTRLFASLDAVGFETDMQPKEFSSIIDELLDHNTSLIAADDDLGIVLFVTAGGNPTYLGTAADPELRKPNICVHTFCLPFDLWRAKLDTGQHLITPATIRSTTHGIDPRIKHRSRLQWLLADRDVRRGDPAAQALLVDDSGHITETGTSNVFIVANNILRTPATGILDGISRRTVAELAKTLRIPFKETSLAPHDVATADEAFTSSTPYCLLPVTRYNNRLVGHGQPGPTFERLMAAWSELVGVNIADQLRSR